MGTEDLSIQEQPQLSFGFLERDLQSHHLFLKMGLKTAFSPTKQNVIVRNNPDPFPSLKR
jgi:hypothetical protein